jgi:ribonuclease D
MCRVGYVVDRPTVDDETVSHMRSMHWIAAKVGYRRRYRKPMHPYSNENLVNAVSQGTPSNFTWIDQPGQLAERLQAWGTPPLLALDTEFIRERTWYPQLALVQLTVPGHDVLLVDPTASGVAELLRPLLRDASVTKLMHSASEDVQALLRGCDAAPGPLFDTQIAAALAGIGAGIGYQKLVENLLGVALPKSETRSDWLRRPLSPAQLEYAADDVLHLHALHAFLQEKLHALGREEWLAEDCARLLIQSAQDTPDPHPHLGLRSAQYLDPEAQARLSRLLRWRETQARNGDRPRGWILDNELAVTLARKPPVDTRALHAFLDTQPKAPRRLRGELWDALSARLTAEERDIPLARLPDSGQKQQLRAMQEAISGIASQLGLPDAVLASRRTLEALLEGRDWPQSLQGWRKPLLEPALAPLLTR